MCVYVEGSAARRSNPLFPSTSAYLAAHLTKFRNLPKEEEVDAGNIVRRVVAELGYLCLIGAAVFEIAVRVTLAALLILPALGSSLLCCDEECDAPLWVIQLGGYGLIGGTDTALRCVAALVKNVTEERFRYSSLGFCQLC